MSSNYFCRQIKDYNLDDMCLQQNRATSHTNLVNRGLLRKKYPERVFSRLNDVNCTARCYNLTFLDFLLWGFVKNRVYANNSQYSWCAYRDIAGNVPQSNRKLTRNDWGRKEPACRTFQCYCVARAMASLYSCNEKLNLFFSTQI